MSTLLLIPMCPECHYLFEEFNVCYNKENINKNVGICVPVCSPSSCPKCGMPISGITLFNSANSYGEFCFDLREGLNHV